MKLFDIAERLETVMWRREEDVPEPRLVLAPCQLPHDGRADRDVHAAVRHLAHLRLGGARHRAAHRRQDHPPVRQLHRARKTGRSCRSTTRLSRESAASRHVRSHQQRPPEARPGPGRHRRLRRRSSRSTATRPTTPRATA